MSGRFLRCVAVLCALLAAAPAQADQSTPLFYNKTTIAIIRQSPPTPAEPAMPWQTTPTPEDPRLEINVEVRDAMILYNQQGWYNLSSPEDNTGVLLMFAAPGIAPVVPSSQYAPLDILMINAEGRIDQIVPNIMLSELDQEILPQSPILGFLFLKGGACERKSIQPGDTVEYKLFHKPPKVLTAPVAKPLSGPAPAPSEPPPESMAKPVSRTGTLLENVVQDPPQNQTSKP